LEFGVHSAS
jgi:hypothetical protein